MKRVLASAVVQCFGGLVLAALSGVLLFLAMPPHSLGFMAWIALIPSILAQFLLAPRDWMARLYQGLTFALGIGLTVFRGIPANLVPASFSIPLAIGGTVLVVGALIFVMGLPTGVPSFHRRTRFRYFVIGPAVAWVGFEFLRMVAQLGHVWGLLATSQGDNLPFLQLVALGGPWLLGLLIVAMNYGLGLAAVALLSPRDREAARRPAVVALAVLALLLAAAYAWGALRSGERRETVCVAAIQPGAELGDVPSYLSRWAARDWEGLSREIIPAMAVYTRQAAEQGAQLVVWPEATIWLDPLDPDSDPYTREQLAGLAQETGITLVVPYFILTPEGYLSWWLGFAPGMRNETLVVTPEGQFLQPPYAKNHPIPFIGELSSTAGRYPVHALPFGRVATMLGYDTTFTDTARELAGRGAQLLTLSTHDWTQMSGTYGMHTRLRAVENGVAIAKSDWEVGSLITDPWGRVLDAAPTDRTAEKIVVADVPLLAPGGTLYTRVGDVLGYVCLVGMVVFLVTVRIARR